ncbi:hypothetical protein [Methyloceanibacter sp.]|uniref:hypothetical protein n=1 Tax=Methyloceanibacter sp. TaxID=1965321 RepID=UPI002CB44ADC|nr:hypothetical protein [Methyloceanibacter sp.]HML93247.1 hypothetical protein [Methyloceanibacter sp.]
MSTLIALYRGADLKKAPKSRRKASNTSAADEGMTREMCLAVAKMTDQPQSDHSARFVKFCRRVQKARQARHAHLERVSAESGYPIEPRKAQQCRIDTKSLSAADRKFVEFVASFKR